MSKQNRNNSNRQEENDVDVEQQVESSSDVQVEATVAVVEQPAVVALTEQPKPVVKQEIKPVMTNLSVFLNSYLESITKLKHDDEVAKVQISFYRKILEILNKPSFEETRLELNTILKFIHANYKNGLNEVNLFRGAAHWDESPEAFSTFRRLIWVFLETADPKKRKSGIKNVDLTALEKTLSPVQYNNFISFYS